MTAHLDLDETGAPVSITDIAGTSRALTAWGVVDVGDAAALMLTTGAPVTAEQAAAIGRSLAPDRADLQAKLQLARTGQLTAIEHATAWEAEARAARRPPAGQVAAPATEPIPRAAPATGPATVEIMLPRSGTPTLTGAPATAEWVDLDQYEAHEDQVVEPPRARWYDVLALLLLAALGIAGIIAGVHFDSLVVAIFGGCCTGAALGVAVAAP